MTDESREEADAKRVERDRCALHRIQSEAIAAADRTESVVDELIAERRADAARESRFGDVS